MTFHKPKALARRWGAAALAGTMMLGLMPTVHAQTSTQSDIPVVADWKFEQQYTQGSIAAGNLVIEDQSGNGNNLVMETYGQGNWEDYLSFSADSMTGAGGSLVLTATAPAKPAPTSSPRPGPPSTARSSRTAIPWNLSISSPRTGPPQTAG